MNWVENGIRSVVVYERMKRMHEVLGLVTMVASINTLYHSVPSKCNLNAYFSEFQEGIRVMSFSCIF